MNYSVLGVFGKSPNKIYRIFFHAQHPVSMGRFKEHLATSSFHIRLFVPVALCAHNSLCLTAKWSRWESISQGQIWLVIKSWSTLLPFYQDKYLAKNFLILASLSGILGPSQQAYVQRQSASQEAERDLQSGTLACPWLLYVWECVSVTVQCRAFLFLSLPVNQFNVECV